MTTDQRRTYGGRLREFRAAAGFSGQGFAEAVGWPQSKVSRIETGAQRISDPDLDTWITACGIDTDDANDLHRDLRTLRLDEARWKTRVQHGHEQLQVDFGTLEQSSSRIRVFETALVPGPAQTYDYALNVFRALAALRGNSRDPNTATAARMERQPILYDTSKDIQILVGEAALRTPPPWVEADDTPSWAEVMSGQIDRLIALLGLRPAQFRVLPLGVPLPAAPLHGFWILDDLINIELLHTEVTTRDPADSAFYTDLFDRLWARSVRGEQARAILLDVLNHTWANTAAT